MHTEPVVKLNFSSVVNIIKIRSIQHFFAKPYRHARDYMYIGYKHSLQVQSHSVQVQGTKINTTMQQPTTTWINRRAMATL